MAKGTTAGFFGKRKPPAVLKHEVLKQYTATFTGMVGATNTEGRVVFLDGYAGAGRYDDGSPGSPLLTMSTSLGMLPGRKLECVFVERDRKPFLSLQEVTAEFRARGVPAVAVRGKVEDHLDAVITQAVGVPLFIFLDPCGVPLAFQRLVNVLTGPRAGRMPSTEVLLNFSDKAVRHIGGQLAVGLKDQSGLASLNLACGGDWWQADYLKAAASDGAEAGVQAVVYGYAQRLHQEANASVISVPVRVKPEHLPLYHLVFATRSNYGLWVFGDSLAKAQKEWRAAQFEEEPDDPMDAGLLFGTEEILEARERDLQRAATAAIRKNLIALLERDKSFKLLDQVLPVFEGWYGTARETWVRDAIKAMNADGLTDCNGVGRRIRELVITRPSSGASPT